MKTPTVMKNISCLEQIEVCFVYFLIFCVLLVKYSNAQAFSDDRARSVSTEDLASLNNFIQVSIDRVRKYSNKLCLFHSPPLPPKFCTLIVSCFSVDLQWSQEKTKTMLIQNLRGQRRVQ